MAKLGSEKNPVIARVHTEEMAKMVATTCAEHGWHYIIGFEPPEVPEDISDLQKLLNPELFQARSENVARNSHCPCGSGKKFKKCCVGVGLMA